MALKARVKPKLGLVRLEGWGNLADCRSEGLVLRRDGDHVIIRTVGAFVKDSRFWLDNGKLCGTSGVSGHKIHEDDLKRIRQVFRLDLDNAKNNKSLQEEELDDMPLTLTKKKVTAKEQPKNGKKAVSVSDEVNEVIKRGPGRPKKVETEELPETKPSTKNGQKVSAASTGKSITGKRGRPRKVETEEVPAKSAKTAAKPTDTVPGKRGRPSSVTIPVAGKGELVVAMSDGAYDSMLNNFLPNVRSKKTTDEEKDFATRFKAAVHVPVKGWHIVLNKAAAAVFLTITEAAAEHWSESGVAGAHYRRGTARIADEIRAHFKLKHGIKALVKVEKAPAKKQTLPLKKAAARVAAKKQEVEEDDEEEEAPAPKRKVGRPKLKKSAVGKVKSK